MMPVYLTGIISLFLCLLGGDPSSFQLFFQSKLVGEHMLDKQQELPRPSGCNHSCGISIQVEIHL
jgi:hypothetical protein